MTRTHVYIGGPWHKRVITNDAPAHYKEFPESKHNRAAALKNYTRVRTFGEHRQSIIWVWEEILQELYFGPNDSKIISVDVSMRLNIDIETRELWVELNEAQP